MTMMLQSASYGEGLDSVDSVHTPQPRPYPTRTWHPSPQVLGDGVVRYLRCDGVD